MPGTGRFSSRRRPINHFAGTKEGISGTFSILSRGTCFVAFVHEALETVNARGNGAVPFPWKGTFALRIGNRINLDGNRAYQTYDLDTLVVSGIIIHTFIHSFIHPFIHPVSCHFMMDMGSKDTHLNPPPSYAESIADQTFVVRSPPPPIQKPRYHHVDALLTTHIRPHLPRSTFDGISSRTLVLVPSNVSGLRPMPAVAAEPDSYLTPFDHSAHSNGFINESIIGFPSTENLMLVRLHGDENTLEFWQQDQVIEDLETQLKAELRDAGRQVLEDYYQERMDRSNRKNRAVNDRADWRAATERALQDGEVRVSIRIKEVSLRMENVMGLYETRGGKAIVVRVEFGRW